MKRTRIFLGLLCFIALALALLAANPTFQSFVASQFTVSVPGNFVAIKSGALVTNLTGSFIGDGAGLTNLAAAVTNLSGTNGISISVSGGTNLIGITNVNAGLLTGLITNAQQEDVTNGTPNPNYAVGVFTGDSQSTGYMATPWPYFLTNNFGVTFGYATNTSLNSETAYSLSTNFQNQIGNFLGTNQTIVFVLSGILDVGVSSVDQIFNSLTNIYARCHASNALVVAFTLPPVMLTNGNPASWPESFLVKIAELNQKLRYSPKSWDYLVDIASGVAPDIFNTNYFVDGLHMSTQTESNLAFVTSQVLIRAPHANTTVPMGRTASLNLYASGTNGNTLVFGPDNVTLLSTNQLTLSVLTVTNVTQAGGTGFQLLATGPGADSLIETFGASKNWIVGNNASPGNFYFADVTDGGVPFYIAPSGLIGALVLNSAGVTVGTFSGNGAGLTALNASAVTSGTLPLAQLPGTVLTNNNASAVTFATNLTVSGTNIGNGRLLTNLNASSLASGTVPAAQLGLVAGTNIVIVGSTISVGSGVITNQNAGYVSVAALQLGGVPQASGTTAMAANTGQTTAGVTGTFLGFLDQAVAWLGQIDTSGDLGMKGYISAGSGFQNNGTPGESYILTIQTNAVGPHGYTITFTGGIETAHATY